MYVQSLEPNPFKKNKTCVTVTNMCVSPRAKKEYVKRGEKYLFSTNHLAGGRISLRQELKWVCVCVGGGGLKWGRERGKGKAKGGRNF